MADFYNNNSFIINFIGINAIMALSIYITLSCAMLTLSNAASMAIGAYTASLLTMNAGWPLLPAVVAGAAFSSAVALVLGLAIGRLRGVFLAIATIGFSEVVRIILVNLDVVGGSEGLRLNTGNVTINVGFWEIYGTLAFFAFFFSRLKGSKMGLALEAIREDESAARTMAINVTFYKVTAYVIGAAIAATGGALYAHLRQFISPADFGFSQAVQILLFAVIGGTFAWRGAIIGAFVVTILPDVIRVMPLLGGIDVKNQPEIFTGLVLLAVILFLPNGLLTASLGINLKRRVARPRVESPGSDTWLPEGSAEDPQASKEVETLLDPVAARAKAASTGEMQHDEATNGAGPGLTEEEK
ncbi:MAG: branched-chain amino acid ABC transporter permease [Chloroflexota bacterium]|nr:branched-chain amino acid ABC transporter permease [Chloroflexota bacterium]